MTVGALVVGGDYRGLGIVRSLGRKGIPVYVAQGHDRLAGFSRYAQRTVPWPDGEPAEQVEYLLRLADQLGMHGWVLFPTADETAWLVSHHHAQLAERFRLTTSPWDGCALAMNKRLAYERAQSLGLDTPRTWYPASVDELDELDVEFPVIVKPAMRILDNQLTQDKAWRVEDLPSLRRRFAEACTLLPVSEVMVQGVIPGAGACQLAFAAACDDGQPVASVIARRTRQFPIEFGRASTFVETIDRPDVLKASLRLLQELRLTGLVEIEFKEDPRDGRLKLLDINARVWGWHSIGRAAGVDFPYLAWKIALGEPVVVAQGRAGVRWVRLSIDLPVSLREVAARRLSLWPYVRSLRAPLEGPIAARDDPLPAIVDLPLLARRAVKRLLYRKLITPRVRSDRRRAWREARRASVAAGPLRSGRAVPG